MKPRITQAFGLFHVKDGEKMPWADYEPVARVAEALNRYNGRYPLRLPPVVVYPWMRRIPSPCATIDYIYL